MNEDEFYFGDSGVSLRQLVEFANGYFGPGKGAGNNREER